MNKRPMKMYSAKYFNSLIILGLLLFSVQQAFSQTYQVNGSAINDGNGLVRLTAAGIGNQTASAWSTTQIDLTQTFDKSFNMFFGCDTSANGGDGMTFTFQNDPRGLNAVGDGFGFLGLGGSNKILPAISIEFDTYDGTASGGGNEISADHIAVDINGDVNQDPLHGGNGFNYFTGTLGNTSVQAVQGGRDLENCSSNSGNYYNIRVVWTYTSTTVQTLQLYEEGILTMTYSGNLIATIFSGNNMVYWGFTGATGSASNEQWIAPSGSIIPWQCSASTSCCTPFTVTPTSPTAICNNPITLSVANSYSSYNWSDGTNAATTQVTAPGTYTLNVLQNQGGNLCPGSATFTITPTGPTAILSGTTTLCNSSQTTPLSVALTGTAPWTLIYAIDGVNQPAINNITSSPYVFQANGSHVYSLVSVADNSGCNSTATGTATVDLYPGLPVGHDANFTAPGTANLSVDNSGGTYKWYDVPTGGTLVNTGDTFTTPVLNATTTYYVENAAITGYVQKHAALLNQSAGNGANTNDQATGLPPAVCFLDFTANSNFLFDTITCAVNATSTGTGQVTVYITSYTTPGPFAGAETVAKDSINIPVTASGLQNILIPLHFSCVAGTNYHISYNATGVLQTEMYWQMLQSSSYPITATPELTIQQYGTPNTRYPGLFDWKIRVAAPSSSCGRTPVTAYTCPAAALTGNAMICNDGSTTPLTVVLTGKTPWTLTYAIDGVNQPSITNILSSPYIFQSKPGAHTYTLVDVSNSSCNGSVSGTASVTLTTGSPIGHDNTFTAPGTTNLSVDDGGDTYQWFDAPTGGTLVYTGAAYTTPVLNTTTTYYVNNASIVNVTSKHAAILNHAAGNGANINDQATGLPPAVCFLDFTANSNFTFDTITCAVNSTGSGTGQVTVYITSYTTPGPFAGAETIAKDSINIPISASGVQNILIPLHYTCTAGTNYHISYNATGVLQTEMYWQFLQASSFPITTQPELTIQQYGVPNTRYPGLFDWKISTVSTAPTCGRTPVTAYVCPTAVLSGDAVICNDGTSTSNLSVALSGDSPWAFTYAIDGITQTAVTGIASTPYVFASATGAHSYTLISVSNGHSTGCSNGTSGTATVSVNPDAPTGHDGVFIPGTSINLSVDNDGGNFNWFSTPTGGSALTNANVNTNTYTTPVLTTTTTYYVQRIIGTDTSCMRTPVTAYLCPTGILTGDAILCNDGTSIATLSVTLTEVSPWTLTYAIDGVNQTAVTNITTSPYLFNSLPGAHVYSLTSVSNATSTGCSSNTSGSATVTLKPAAPIGHDGTFISPGTALLSVDNTVGSTYNWYDAPTGGNLVNTGSAYTTPTLTANTTYYVEQVIGGQISCTRTPVIARVLVPSVPLFIPNLMTPNDDGKNDRFEILGLPDGSTVGIYNRWGDPIYQSDNYDNKWAAPNTSAGVYFYELKLKNGESYKGWLEIIW